MADTFTKTSRRPARVLIVDDHPLVRRGLAELIAQEPDITVCGDADDSDVALQTIAATRPDLVIVDLSLKTGSGIDLIKRLRSQHADLKVLVSSMHDETLYAERALHAGAQGYINKQVATDKVIEAIRHVLDGQIYLSAEMTDQILHRLTKPKPDSGQHSVVESLSNRELEVFNLIGQGLSTRQIAERLHLSIKTIETHREHIKSKLSLSSGTELTRHAVQWVLENE